MHRRVLPLATIVRSVRTAFLLLPLLVYASPAWAAPEQIGQTVGRLLQRAGLVEVHRGRGTTSHPKTQHARPVAPGLKGRVAPAHAQPAYRR